MQDVLCLILGGGRGTRLYPLTKHRSEPAVPIAGKYRLIDIPISNCLNSKLNRIYVLTQYLSVSLHRHLSHTYKFDPFSHGFVEVLAAQQTNEAAEWYQGTADAVRQNIRYVHDDPARDVLVLSGDQLYRMDLRQLVQTHRESQEADVTLAALPVARPQASGVGLLRTDEAGRIVQLVEKPQSDAQLGPLRMPPEWLDRRGIARRGREFLANMGIYLFRREALFEMLNSQLLEMDFVLQIFPRCFRTHRFQTHLFDGYWSDLGTIQRYYEASLALTDASPPFDFHTSEVIYTRMRYLPASRLDGASLRRCLISDGCIVQEGAKLEHCSLGVRSRIGRDAVIRDTVIIGADRFETDAEREENRRLGIPDFTVGDGATIERAILDKDCRIGRNVRIVNRHKVQDAEGENYVIRDGIVVIPNSAVVPDGSVI